jgi:hypothetical protein
MMHDLSVALFVMVAGLTASGIVANLYKLAAGKAERAGGRAL